jgi:hypothetical protein
MEDDRVGGLFDGTANDIINWRVLGGWSEATPSFTVGLPPMPPMAVVAPAIRRVLITSFLMMCVEPFSIARARSSTPSSPSRSQMLARIRLTSVPMISSVSNFASFRRDLIRSCMSRRLRLWLAMTAAERGEYRSSLGRSVDEARRASIQASSLPESRVCSCWVELPSFNKFDEEAAHKALTRGSMSSSGMRLRSMWRLISSLWSL